MWMTACRAGEQRMGVSEDGDLGDPQPWLLDADIGDDLHRRGRCRFERWTFC